MPLLEESWVDTEARTITTYTRNVGLANFMSAIEKVVYKVIIIIFKTNYHTLILSQF